MLACVLLCPVGQSVSVVIPSIFWMAGDELRCLLNRDKCQFFQINSPSFSRCTIRLGVLRRPGPYDNSGGCPSIHAFPHDRAVLVLHLCDISYHTASLAITPAFVLVLNDRYDLGVFELVNHHVRFLSSIHSHPIAINGRTQLRNAVTLSDIGLPSILCTCSLSNETQQNQQEQQANVRLHILPIVSGCGCTVSSPCCFFCWG